MQNIIRKFSILAGGMLFAIGLVVGQQTQRAKFEKYSRPTSVTAMDVALMRANIDAIRNAMEFGVPIIHYDNSCGCFEARVVITKAVTSKPLDEVRATLLAKVFIARSSVESHLPEVSPHNPLDSKGVDRDFVMKFFELNLDAEAEEGQKLSLVAEYVAGKLVVR